MTKSERKVNGIWFVSVAAILWGFDGIVRGDLRNTLPAINIVFYEHFFALILLIPILWWKRVEILSLKLKDWAIFSIIGLLAGTLGTLFYTAALGQIFFAPLSIVVLLQQLQPIWAISSSKIILKEKLPPKFLFWAILALIGAYLISFKDLIINFNTGDKTLLAAIFGLLAGLFWGVSTTLGKFQLKKISFWTTTSLRFLTGTIFSGILMIILPLAFGSLSNILAFPLSYSEINFSLEMSQFWNLIIIVFVTGLVPMLIYYFGLKNTQAKKATLAELLWPATALIIDLFYNINTKVFGFRGDNFSLTQILGIILILICVFQISKLKEEKTLDAKEVN